MASPFVAEIRMIGSNFAPAGWAQCNGQLMPISQNTALFSLLGTFYGGDGKSTFALPNLEGSAAMHQGQGPGLTERFLGETAGAETVTLLTTEMPAHAHFAQANADGPVTANPGNAAWTAVDRTASAPYGPPNNLVPMNPMALPVAGGSTPHNNRQPYLVVNFIIAMQGVFPPRS